MHKGISIRGRIWIANNELRWSIQLSLNLNPIHITPTSTTSSPIIPSVKWSPHSLWKLPLHLLSLSRTPKFVIPLCTIVLLTQLQVLSTLCLSHLFNRLRNTSIVLLLSLLLLQLLMSCSDSLVKSKRDIHFVFVDPSWQRLVIFFKFSF
jgi:hypothetical protein